MVAEASVETHADGRSNGALKAVTPSTPTSVRAPESEAMTLREFYITEEQIKSLGLAEASGLARLAGAKIAEVYYLMGEMLKVARADKQHLRTDEMLDLVEILEAVTKDFKMRLLTPTKNP